MTTRWYSPGQPRATTWAHAATPPDTRCTSRLPRTAEAVALMALPPALPLVGASPESRMAKELGAPGGGVALAWRKAGRRSSCAVKSSTSATLKGEERKGQHPWW